MTSKLAKLMESNDVDLRDNIVVETGHGTLPSNCECGGVLDWAWSKAWGPHAKTVLVCRECKKEKELD